MERKKKRKQGKREGKGKKEERKKKGERKKKTVHAMSVHGSKAYWHIQAYKMFLYVWGQRTIFLTLECEHCYRGINFGTKQISRHSNFPNKLLYFSSLNNIAMLIILKNSLGFYVWSFYLKK